MTNFTEEQRSLLTKHGYNPDVPASGIGGPPREWMGASKRIRTRVCYLEGVEIDGHRMSDLDNYMGPCIHCGGYDEWDDSEFAIEWRAEQR